MFSIPRWFKRNKPPSLTELLRCFLFLWPTMQDVILQGTGKDWITSCGLCHSSGCNGSVQFQFGLCLLGIPLMNNQLLLSSSSVTDHEKASAFPWFLDASYLIYYYWARCSVDWDQVHRLKVYRIRQQRNLSTKRYWWNFFTPKMIVKTHFSITEQFCSHEERRRRQKLLASLHQLQKGVTTWHLIQKTTYESPVAPDS